MQDVDNSDAYYQDYLSFFSQATAGTDPPITMVYCLTTDLIISVGDGEFTITDGRNKRSLEAYQLVVIRGHLIEQMDAIKAVCIFAGIHGIQVVNDYSSFRSMSKLSQALMFHTRGIPVAKTTLLTLRVLAELDELPIAYPCIMKVMRGSHGNDNFKVTSATHIRALQAEHSNRQFVLQRFIPNQFDYRVLVIGTEELIIKRYAAANSHLNNTSQGGHAELAPTDELPASVITTCHHIAESQAMTIAGIDVLYDSEVNNYSYLEINSQPQLMTGAFIQEKAALLGRYLKQVH
jgi:glutathione synthase/RimK-type ligase-like ATP-grasp enzyme